MRTLEMIEEDSLHCKVVRPGCNRNGGNTRSLYHGVALQFAGLGRQTPES